MTSIHSVFTTQKNYRSLRTIYGSHREVLDVLLAQTQEQSIIKIKSSNVNSEWSLQQLQ